MKRGFLLFAVFAMFAAASPAQAATTQSVDINGTFSGGSFNPATKVIARGDKVKWVGKGSGQHTSTNSAPLRLWGSPSLNPGGTYTSPTFIAAGTYPYVCAFHSRMIGKIQVPLSAVKSGRKITLTVASAPAPTTHKFVIQRKNGTSYAPLATVATPTFVFNAPAAGTYTFRAAYQKNGTTAPATFFSVPVSVSVV